MIGMESKKSHAMLYGGEESAKHLPLNGHQLETQSE